METALRIDSLQTILDNTIEYCIDRYKEQKLHSDELAISLVHIQNPDRLNWAGYRSDVPIFPASVVKLFYAYAAYHWLEEGKIEKTAEFDRAMCDMLVESSNDATSYIVDLLTGTTSGLELVNEQEIDEWSRKRNSINDFFRSIGYEQINVNQKPWGDGPYGRERVFLGSSFENRNKLTTYATAELLVNIVLQKGILPDYCAQLLSYIERDRSKPSEGVDDQSHGFIAGALPENAKIWSKAGWTSTARHDALYVDLDGGKTKLCLVIFTTNHAKEPEILQEIGREIISRVLVATGSRGHE